MTNFVSFPEFEENWVKWAEYNLLHGFSSFNNFLFEVFISTWTHLQFTLVFFDKWSCYMLHWPSRKCRKGPC